MIAGTGYIFVFELEKHAVLPLNDHISVVEFTVELALL